MKFSNTDKFLVFNYTHTLQKVYQIGDYNICYVHGECTGEEDAPHCQSFIIEV